MLVMPLVLPRQIVAESVDLDRNLQKIKYKFIFLNVEILILLKK